MKHWNGDLDREERIGNYILNGLLFLLVSGIVAFIYFGYFYNTELVRMRATIIEHNVTSTKGGHAVYNTLVRYENGDVQNIESDENLYVVPVGSYIYKEIRVNKKE